MNAVKISILGILFFCGLLILGPYAGINLLSKSSNPQKIGPTSSKKYYSTTPSTVNSYRTIKPSHPIQPNTGYNITQPKKSDKLTEIEDLLK